MSTNEHKLQSEGGFVWERMRSVRCATAGVTYVVRSQKNAWVHAGATVGVIASGTWLRLSAGEWCWLIAAMGAVWTAEAMNTAFELLCDVACPEFHPLIGRAKDAAAGAVLVAACAAVGIGACVMGPHLFVGK